MQPDEKEKLERRPIDGWKLGGHTFGDLKNQLRREEKPDFSEGAMSGKFQKLKKAGLGTTFNRAAQATGTISTTTIDLATGAIIGGAYEIIKLIGRGGMGEVYLAEHRTLKKNCALKLIPPDQVTEMGWRRFQQEAKAFAKLDHINLVKVSDLGIHAGCLPFYAMELVVGRTLADMLTGQRALSVRTALELFMQVCDGVAFAHKVGIIHRDIKPANIMITRNAGGKVTVKILDFGLAKLSQHDRDQQSLTFVGDIFGSPFYMSPEQCCGEDVDHRSDLYSIGCTLFECLTGVPPFNGHLSAAIIFSHQESEPPTLSSIAGHEFDPSLENVMARLLRKDPEDRYQAVATLRDDLEKVMRGEEVRPYVPTRKGRRRQEQARDEQMDALYDAKYEAKYEGKTARDNDAPAVRDRFKHEERLSNRNSQNDDEDNDEADDDDENELPLWRRPLLLGALALVILTAAGLTVYFTQIKHAPLTSKNNSATTVASSAVPTPRGIAENAAPAKNDGNSVNENSDQIKTFFDRQGNPQERLKDAPKSSLDSDYYSTIVKANDKVYRQFAFPKDITIGTISVEKQPNWIAAIDKVTIPVDAKLQFAPATFLVDYPVYFKRFRSGEIWSLALMRPCDVNLMIAAASQYPGFSTLHALSLYKQERVNEKSLALLDRCQSVTNLETSEQAIDVLSLCRLSWLKNLESLALIRYMHTDALLESLNKGKSLQKLELNECRITEAGRISMHGMQKLELVNLTHTLDMNSDLLALSKLPNLTALRIGDELTINDTTLQLLSACKKLDTLTLGVSHHYSPAARFILQKTLNSVRIFYE